MKQLRRFLLSASLGFGIIFISQAQTLPAQIRVVDARSGQPIPYASIGVRGRPLGTVADAAGTFPLSRIGLAAAADTVVVSCVGYAPRKLLAGQLQPATELRLTPQQTKLAEVVVRGRQPRRVLLGHNWVSAFTSMPFYLRGDTVPHIRLGRELGPLLKIKHPTRLKSFHLFTSGRDFKTVTFRLNIYAVQNGEPQNSLLRQDIIFTVNGQQRGWTAVDLRPYSIMLEGTQEVVATVQWLGSEAGRPNSLFLDVPAHLSAFHTTFRREKSGQGWTKYGVNPSFYFKALSYPE
ncbi:carboxypeptidase-like regulatory domain-containing protein [uncultured Hymenobacter sp.]|uniref:carboxypeptidase-like regulatory domain-containing protein n=1 Tax=uncultured Hymenobacter sp. TaxID=170016 RepID=UPI0035CB4942